MVPLLFNIRTSACSQKPISRSFEQTASCPSNRKTRTVSPVRASRNACEGWSEEKLMRKRADAQQKQSVLQVYENDSQMQPAFSFGATGGVEIFLPETGARTSRRLGGRRARRFTGAAAGGQWARGLWGAGEGAFRGGGCHPRGIRRRLGRSRRSGRNVGGGFGR